jgi:PPM family protein phosphatase
LRAVRAASFSSAGRRESNQDRATVVETTLNGASAVVLAVADGIGGLEGGEEAATIAIDAIGRFARERLPGTSSRPAAIERALLRAFEQASDAIEGWSRGHPSRGPAGCMLTCAVVWGRRYLVAHVGDTRCYHVGARGACALTEDHTEAQRLAREGLLPPGLARQSPLRHRLTHALGWAPALRVDIVPGDGGAGELEDGEALLVCSDGVHEAIGEADLAEVSRPSADPGEAAERLVALALARGSLDNASVALVRAEPARRRLDLPRRAPLNWRAALSSRG